MLPLSLNLLIFCFSVAQFAVVQRTLQNGDLRVKVLDWGATITSVHAPDKNGTPGEITLGWDEVAPYTDGRRFPTCHLAALAHLGCMVYR